MIPQSKQYYINRDWQIFYKLLCPIERRVVYVIAQDNLTTNQVAYRCLDCIDRIAPVLARLVEHGVVYSFMDTWSIDDREFQSYCQGVAIDTAFDAEAIVPELFEELRRLIDKRHQRIREIGLRVPIEAFPPNTLKELGIISIGSV